MGNNVNVRRSERIKNSPTVVIPEFGAATEWKSNAVANIIYMIQDRDYYSNVDTDDILLLQAEWDAERESYDIKTQSHDHDNPTYMEELSGENLEEYFKAMDDEILSLMRRYTWEIVSRKSVPDHNIIPGTWSLKCNV